MTPAILAIISSSSQSAREPILNKFRRINVNGNDARINVSFAPLVQHVHSMPAIVFPCGLAHKIGFDKDDLSFTSFEKRFGQVAWRQPWSSRGSAMLGNLNIAKQLNEGTSSIANRLTSSSCPRLKDSFSTAANISMYPLSMRENSKSET